MVIYSMIGSRPTLMKGIDSLSQDTPLCLLLWNCSEVQVKLGISAARWADHRWSIRWREGTSRLHSFFDDVDALPPGMGLPKTAWVRLNRLRTEVSLFQSLMHKWGMISTASCECGAEEQTADHIYDILFHIPPSKWVRGLLTVNESLARWLSDTCPPPSHLE